MGFLCVFLRTVSGSCGVRSKGTGISGCLSTEHPVLSLSVLATGVHEHI